MKETLIQRSQIQELIPQRDPIIMVDALYAFTTDRVQAGLTIQESTLGVFKGFLQESGIIEHMAQTVALHTGYDYYIKKQTPPTGYIGAIKKIEIEKLPKLGDVLITEATILQEFLGVTLVSLTTYCEGARIAYGEMKTVIASTDENIE